jgi:hypothetical protein
MHVWARTGSGRVVLLKVDATVRELSECSLLLDLSCLLCVLRPDNCQFQCVKSAGCFQEVFNSRIPLLRLSM